MKPACSVKGQPGKMKKTTEGIAWWPEVDKPQKDDRGGLWAWGLRTYAAALRP